MMGWHQGREMNKVFNVYALSEDHAVIEIYSHIGNNVFDEMWGDVTPQMVTSKLREHRGKDIDVRVNSNGGNTTAANAIFNALKSHDGRVTAYVDGIAASAASMIILAADEIVAPANSLIMIHNPWTYGRGESKDLRKSADTLDKIRGQMLDLYAARATISREEISELMDAETYMTGTEAVAMGFADTLGENIEIYASSNHVYAGNQTFARASARIPDRIYATVIAHKPDAPAPPSETPEEAVAMKTVEDLRAAHPDLVAEIEASASKAAVEADRQRIKDIEEISAAMPKDLVQRAKFDTGVEARDLALQALRADASAGEKYMKSRASEQEDGALVNATPPEKESKSDANAAQAASMFGRKYRRGGKK